MHRSICPMGVVALGALLAAALPANAQNKPEVIKREQSKLWLENVPGLANAPTIYVYSGWTPNYSAERFYAQAVPGSAPLPRLHVNLAMLAPGFVWMSDSALGEKYVKDWPFFKDRDVTMAREHSGGSSGAITVPFRSGDANCFAFLIRNVSIGLIGGTGSGGRPSVDGVYCGAPGAALDAALMQNVMASIHVTEDLARVRSSLIKPVATTPAATVAAAPPRSVTLAWQGLSESLPGTMEVQPEVNGGRFNLTLPQNIGPCFGAWRQSGNASQGAWSIHCPTGLTAKGSYRMDTSHRGTGDGVDSQGRKIEIRFGS
jgi:hypothetical protein